MEKIKEWCSSLKKYFLKTFIKREGGKNTFNFEAAVKALSFIMSPLLFLYFYFGGENTAYVGRTSNSLVREPENDVSAKGQSDKIRYGFPVQSGGQIAGTAQSGQSANLTRHNSIKLAAKQVLIREGSSAGFGFHAGLNFIGELQSTIDTRDPAQIVRVALPYGAQSKDGGSELPKGTLLLGQVSYPGRGEKVFIQFQQVVLPDGKTFKITAVALDPQDYSTGLAGNIQSQARTRTLSAMGLSAASAMGNVLTEKESMGQYQVEPRATVKNAMIQGLSKAAEYESNKLHDQTVAEDYVLVEAGAPVVISLTQGLNL